MKNLKCLIIPCFIAVSTLALNGCMSSSLEDRAGQWHVYTSMAEFTITVNETGDGIKELSYSVNCFENGTWRSLSLADPIEYQPPIPIKDNAFSIEFSLNGDKYKFAGEFSSDGKTLAGYYKAMTCKEEYHVSRLPVFDTVKIGKQVWMKNNLNLPVTDSWCYEGDPENCEKYGRLYTLEAAQKLCPVGWRIPTKEDWQALFDHCGGIEASFQELMEGGSAGFNAGLGGWAFALFVLKYEDIGKIGSYWTSSDCDDSRKAWTVSFYENNSSIEFDCSTKASTAHSVRYIKD